MTPDQHDKLAEIGYMPKRRTPNAPARPATGEKLRTVERSEILDEEIEGLTIRGYRVVSRTATSAQLLRPKVFSLAWALFGFLFLVVGFVVYLIWYASKRDRMIYLRVDEYGEVSGLPEAGGSPPILALVVIGAVVLLAVAIMVLAGPRAAG
jgi:hypothetical protein